MSEINSSKRARLSSMAEVMRLLVRAEKILSDLCPNVFLCAILKKIGKIREEIRCKITDECEEDPEIKNFIEQTREGYPEEFVRFLN
ncbi:hypothetical protein KKA23_03610 [Patescibacteria group bacterium]|nr:hypothetical protein [Patescibacteria group bacterium]